MRMWPYILFVCGMIGFLTIGVEPAPAESPVSMSDMTGPWQLFIDDHLIARKSDVVRTYHPFKKHPANPVIRPDKPWMDHVVKAGDVLPMEDGPGFRMWHSCWTPRKLDPDKRSRALYSTSPDGVLWEMPILGLVPWVDGSRENNFLPSGAHPMHTPFNDDPKQRYTSMGGCSDGYCVKYSEDGFRWHREEGDRPPIIELGPPGSWPATSMTCSSSAAPSVRMRSGH